MPAHVGSHADALTMAAMLLAIALFTLTASATTSGSPTFTKTYADTTQLVVQ